MLETTLRPQLKLSERAKVSPALDRKWEKKLTANEDNPLPLAPRQYRKPISKYSKEEFLEIESKYRLENKRYGNLCSSFAIAELDDIAKAAGQNSIGMSFINVLGSGLARDLGWLKYAHSEYNATGVILEACLQAVKNAERRLKEYGVLDYNSLEHVEVIGGEEITTNTMFTFASGFIQILKPELMTKVMRRLGQTLDRNHSRLMLVHATDDSNPGVLWGDTTPYTIPELLVPLEEGLGRAVKFFHRGNIPYWHHNYDCIVFEAVS